MTLKLGVPAIPKFQSVSVTWTLHVKPPCETRGFTSPCGLVSRAAQWLCSVYSVVVLVWCFFFIKEWGRCNRTLVYRWNCEKAEVLAKENKKHRYQFHAGGEVDKHGFFSTSDLFVEVHTIEQHPKPTRSFDRNQRMLRIVLSWLMIAVFLVVALLGTVVCLSFRVILMTYVHTQPRSWSLFGLFGDWDLLYHYRVNVSSYIAVVPPFLWRSLMNFVGEKLAQWLNDREDHRRQSDYDNALLYKKFAILFANTYAAFFYISFLKATAAGGGLSFILVWLARIRLLGVDAHVERDYCQDYSHFSLTATEITAAHNGSNPFCMGEVSLYLASTISLTFLSTLWGAIRPVIMPWLCCHSPGKSEDVARELKLQPLQDSHIMDECLKRIIDLGYVVLFAPAFPVAAIFLYVASMIQMRVDSYLLLQVQARPMPNQVAEIAGLHQLLTIVSYAGLITNTLLILFTATQFITLLPFTLPLSAIQITSDNYFVVFVVCEHAVLLAAIAIEHCLHEDHPGTERERTWSKHREPKWVEDQQRKIEDGEWYDGNGPPKIGPWLLLTLPEVVWNGKEDEWSVNFERIQDRWSVDQHSKLLRPASNATAFLKQTDQGSKAKASRVEGRLSEIEPISLTAEAKSIFGIHRDACSFAFAYPLSEFVHGIRDNRRVGDNGDGQPLHLDLELDLHDAIHKMEHNEEFVSAHKDGSERPDPLCQECPMPIEQLLKLAPHEPHPSCRNCHSKELLLRFLAVGGFVYFDRSYNVIQLTVLHPAEKGLEFHKPLISPAAGTCPPRPAAMSGSDGTKDVSLKVREAVRQIGAKLEKRGAFRPPTLPGLRKKGVAGFCWLVPGEVFVGLNTETVDEENPAFQRRNTVLPDVAHVNSAMQTQLQKYAEDIESLKELQAFQNRFQEHHRHFSTELAKEHWPDGAFAYRLFNGSYRIFGVRTDANFKTDNIVRVYQEKRSQLLWQVSTSVVQIQRSWNRYASKRLQRSGQAAVVIQRLWRGLVVRRLRAHKQQR